MGTATNENWPGCVQLLDYKTSFPKWDPAPLPTAIVQHKADDLFLVSTIDQAFEMEIKSVAKAD